MINFRPEPPKVEWVWLSVCSKHRDYDLICDNCNAGYWKTKDELEFNSWLWNYSHRIWKKWVNRLK